MYDMTLSYLWHDSSIYLVFASLSLPRSLSSCRCLSFCLCIKMDHFFRSDPPPFLCGVFRFQKGEKTRKKEEERTGLDQFAAEDQNED